MSADDLLQEVTDAIEVMAHIEESITKDVEKIIALVRELDEQVLDKYLNKRLRSFLLMAAFGFIAGRDCSEKDEVKFAHLTFLVSAQRSFVATQEAAASIN